MSRLGNTLWFLGQLDEARRARKAAIALADEIRHPFSRATALVFASLLALDLRDLDDLREYVGMLQLPSAELEARHAQGQANSSTADALGGLVDVLDGRHEAGIARIQRILAELPRSGYAPGQRATVARLLVEAHVAAGDMRAALAAAEQALETGSVHVWEAEVRRLRAEFLAALGAPRRDVEAELDRALQVARRQGARMLELRAAMSLLHYRMERGPSRAVGAARALLAAALARISGGQDTRDLHKAAALLAQR